MAYKRNPMRSERVCSLSRYLISLPVNAANTHANQWFERTLDDSAIRRIVLPEGFLAVDVILSTLANVSGDNASYILIAIRRMIVFHFFQHNISIDIILDESSPLLDGLHVWPAVVRSNLMSELPFMATEVILMQCVKAGGDRQELHEAIRKHSMDAGAGALFSHFRDTHSYYILYFFLSTNAYLCNLCV